MKGSVMKLGKRICIIGPSSSGKSTLAAALSKKLALPLLHLDQVAHIPYTNWERRPDEEFQAIHDAFIERDEWIVEGNYSSFMPQRFKRADTVIFNQFNRFGCLYRFLKRSFQKDEQRAGGLEGAKNQIGDMVSWILWKAPKKRSIYYQLIAENPHLDVVYIRHFKDMNRLLEK